MGIKKGLIIMLATAVLMFGCAGGGGNKVVDVPEPAVATRPEIIEYIEAGANTAGSHQIRVADYRIDDYTVWVWIDNDSMPGDCDYVVVLDVTSGVKEQYRIVGIMNKTMYENPCEFAYGEHAKYVKEIAEAKERVQEEDAKSNGI